MCRRRLKPVSMGGPEVQRFKHGISFALDSRNRAIARRFYLRHRCLNSTFRCMCVVRVAMVLLFSVDVV